MERPSAVRTIRLSDLLQQGRVSTAGEVASAHVALAVAAPQAPAPEPTFLPKSPSRQAPRLEVIDKIELLAVELLSISKTKKSSPDHAMREALLAMDHFIESLASRH